MKKKELKKNAMSFHDFQKTSLSDQPCITDTSESSFTWYAVNICACPDNIVFPFDEHGKP